jgi:hypothetical protein
MIIVIISKYLTVEEQPETRLTGGGINECRKRYDRKGNLYEEHA